MDWIARKKEKRRRQGKDVKETRSLPVGNVHEPFRSSKYIVISVLLMIQVCHASHPLFAWVKLSIRWRGEPGIDSECDCARPGTSSNSEYNRN